MAEAAPCHPVAEAAPCVPVAVSPSGAQRSVTHLIARATMSPMDNSTPSVILAEATFVSEL